MSNGHWGLYIRIEWTTSEASKICLLKPLICEEVVVLAFVSLGVVQVRDNANGIPLPTLPDMLYRS
jgi:hypothetical protein